LNALHPALVVKAMDRDKVTGVSLLVAFGDDVVLAKGYGLADVEHEVPVTPETVFQIGSVTKQFTAAAILKLVDAGKLRLEDKLRDVLPGYPFSDERVTVHQLLNHTSGITSYTRFRKEFAERGDRPFRHRDFYGFIKDEPFEFEPGTTYKYCNSGYYLLGMIIEEVSGVSYRKFLDDELVVVVGFGWAGSQLVAPSDQRPRPRGKPRSVPRPFDPVGAPPGPPWPRAVAARQGRGLSAEASPRTPRRPMERP